MIVTDVDGCLLDAETYSYEAARPALARLAQAGWPLVLCSGKTRAEMTPLTRALGSRCPFVVENGGAIVFPPGSFDGPVPGAREEGGQRVLGLGSPRGMLVAALRTIAVEAGVRVRGFTDMSGDELRRLTALSPAAAARAM